MCIRDSFKVPPLRERKEDIPLLLDYFLNQFCQREGREQKTVAPEAVTMMQNYDWPGNVRELKNIVERLVIMSPGKTITASHLPDYIGDVSVVSQTDAGKLAGGMDRGTLREAREEFEKEFIIQKLEENNWNVTKTAEAIELERSNLYRKIKSYGIDVKK